MSRGFVHGVILIGDVGSAGNELPLPNIGAAVDNLPLFRGEAFSMDGLGGLGSTGRDYLGDGIISSSGKPI